jgi:hypothetical protein
VEQHTHGDAVLAEGQDTGALRDALRLAQRELKWTQIEHEHQAESLQRVRRQRSRLREQLDQATEVLAEVLSERYWADAGGVRSALGRLAGRGRSAEADLVAEVEASELFDGAWYLRRYPDAVRDRVAPALHLVRHGNERGLDPSERFHTGAYLAAHPDTQGLPALVHHLRSGAEPGGTATQG